MKVTRLFNYFLVAAILIMTSCSKDENEDESVASCKECHNSTTLIYAAAVQYEASVHWLGGTFERNTTDCAPCHTNEGFNEVLETGEAETAADISNPTPISCYTCHFIHEKYDLSDLDLKTIDPVTTEIDGAVIDLGRGNLCVNCHHARSIASSVSPELTATSTADVTISSSRFGPHHGPQSGLLAGVDAFNMSSGGTSHAHSSIEDACISCHMAEAFGRQAGGHTMSVAYEYHSATEPNTAGCLVSGCHGDEDALIEDMEDWEDEFEEKMDQIRDNLVAGGYMDSTYAINTDATFPADVARALYNYKFLEEDKSNGIHNPTFASSLLDGSISATE